MSGKSIRKILIANRGEIALRVMRTCQRLGISTVAVYSDADFRSLHTSQADEAFRIGPAPADQSYLNVESIIDAALRSGADAIHPGYGFLSENHVFADACAAAGLVFIGPAADSIRKMGLKSQARKLVSTGGVPVAPGYDGDDQSLETLKDHASRIGFPLLIKASAGGGGKGMRIVRLESELAPAVESASREAARAFGDGSILLERYVEDARHIEIQILGDNYGNIVHLFERDCSIQRRHQKVIEESPSPALNPELRQQMGDAAVAVGRIIGYSNAGTVEFILSPSGEFYFIEINTRLQVEHPVTEMITGLDLVELQIRVAEGHELPLTQKSVRSHGHAIEARLYAEDPRNNFLPTVGTIRRWTVDYMDGVRIDTGIETGSEIGIHYDPLLAKIIADGGNRESSLRRLTLALQRLQVHGVDTNRDHLISILQHPAFATGAYDTGFIDRHSESLIQEPDDNDTILAAAVVVLYRLNELERSSVLKSFPLNYRNNPYRDPTMRFNVGSNVVAISYRREDDETVLHSGDWRGTARIVSKVYGGLRVEIDGRQESFAVTEHAEIYYVQSSSWYRTITVAPRFPELSAGADDQSADAPMPGLVLKVLVAVGQQIAPGDALVVLEAMKMEQTIRAASGGIVEEIMVKQGDVVSPGERLVRLGSGTL